MRQLDRPRRGIDELQALFLRLRRQLPGDGGRGRGVVHKDRAGLHARKSAICPQDHAAQVGIVAHAGKHDVGTRCRFTRCGGGGVAGAFGGPGSGFGGAAVVHGDVVPGTRQVAGHGVAHHAQAQKGDFLGGGGIVGFGSDLAHGCLVVKWIKRLFCQPVGVLARTGCFGLTMARHQG